jgi:tetratricopeptide (TPR) repeat protein
MTTEPTGVDAIDEPHQQLNPRSTWLSQLPPGWLSKALLLVIATLAVVFVARSFTQNSETSTTANSETANGVNIEKSADLILDSVKFIEDGQYDDAIKVLGEAEKLNPANPLVFYNLGVAQHFSGDLKAAEASYTKALSIDNRLSSAYYNRGLIQRDQGKLREAAADLEIAAALAKDADRAAAYFNLGQVLMSLGEGERAEEMIAKARAIDPTIGK